jgi:heterodisulfide reductase subunit A
VRFLRARPHSIDPGIDGTGVVMRYTLEDGQTHEEAFDMAVLSIGLEAPADCLELARLFDVEVDQYRFAQTSGFEPVQSSREGIFVTGAFQAPKAIPRSVTEASAAAAEAARALQSAKGTLTRVKSFPAPVDVTALQPRVGVFVCSCGINIASVVDVDALAAVARELPNVAFVENNLFTCSADTQVLMAEKIKEHNLNRIVIAACTPRTHEPLFQDTLQEAGLNPYLVEMANIRNQNAWVHQNEPQKATAKAIDQVRMAVAKASRNQSLDRIKMGVVQKSLVIGGGLAGLQASLSMANQGYDTVLLEKAGRLGGNAWHLTKSAQGEDIRSMLTNMIDQVENHPRIKVLKNATLQSATGSVGNFVSKVSVNGDMQAVTYGVAVVATGGKESVPDEYLHGDDSRVLTHLAFDRLLQENPSLPAQVNSVAFIQCVGSREARRPYCSRVCCTHSIQAAVDLKERNPALQVTILYRDIRTYGKREDLYQKARRLGVLFIRYDVDDKPQVTAEREGLWIGTRDPILQQPVRIFADYLVLAAAIEPHKNTELIDLYKCAADADGFLNEAHPKLRPVDMSVEGLYVAGLCNYPKPIDESIGQAMAAASRAGVILNQEEIMLDAIKSFVTDQCDGCALCLDVCPYRAIALEAYEDDSGQPHKRIKTDPALCKGCGVCAATCPKGGVHVHGFTMEQLKAQVAAALHG